MLPEAGERGATTNRVELLRRVAAAQVNLTPAEAKVAALVLAEPSSVLFLTDHLDEARAARGAGMQTIVVRRPGDGGADAGAEFRVVSDFGSL